MSHPPVIEIRSANADDAALLFAWRNDPATRAASVTTDEVALDVHTKWLEASLVSPTRFIYLASASGSEVGMCRFDVTGSTAEVSINLAPNARGKRLARPVLGAAISRFNSELGQSMTLTATVRVENAASAQLFVSLGFVRVRQDADFEHYAR